MTALSIIFTVTLAVAVSAQDLASLAAIIPACALPALEDAAKSVGCGITDYICWCTRNWDSIVAQSSPEVVKTCGVESADVLEATNALCDAAQNVSAAPTPSRDRSSTATSTTTTSSIKSETPTSSVISDSAGTPSAGLSTGAKAGIGAGVAVAALVVIMIAFILWRRRKHSKRSELRHVIGHKDHDVHEKAELPGTEAKAGSRFNSYSKAELPENGSNGAAIAEMEHSERTEAVPELDGPARQQPHSLELGNTESNLGDDQTYLAEKPVSPKNIALPASPIGEQGPLRSASGLHPAPQSQDAIAAEETDFEYQARRLRERRAMIAERKRLAEEEEQIAMEEEALRRRRAAHVGRGS